MTKYFEDSFNRDADDGADLFDLEEEYESINRHPARDHLRENWRYIQIPTDAYFMLPNTMRESVLPDYPVSVGRDICAYDASGKIPVRLVEHSKDDTSLIRVEYLSGRSSWVKISELRLIGSDPAKKEFKEHEGKLNRQRLLADKIAKFGLQRPRYEVGDFYQRNSTDQLGEVSDLEFEDGSWYYIIEYPSGQTKRYKALK